LEGGGAVSHPEKYYEGFKEATVGAEGCFPFISGLDAYIIETPADVQFCEVSSSMELRDEFGDEGDVRATRGKTPGDSSVNYNL